MENLQREMRWEMKSVDQARFIFQQEEVENKHGEGLACTESLGIKQKIQNWSCSSSAGKMEKPGDVELCQQGIKKP